MLTTSGVVTTISVVALVLLLGLAFTLSWRHFPSHRLRSSVLAAAVSPRLRRPLLPGLPPDFDWRSYTLLNPELFNYSQREAEVHYVSYGRRHGKRYQRIPIFLSYDAPWGLCNQMYDHVHMLATALYMNATLVTPRVQSHAVVTRSANGKASDPHFGQYKWEEVEGTLDWERMVSYWGQQGLAIVKAPGPSGCVEGDITAKVGTYPFLSVPEAALLLTAYAEDLVRPQLEANASAHVCVHLKHPNPLWFINPLRSLECTEPVMRGLFFAPAILKKAQDIGDALKARGVTSYSAVHLRVEGDWFANGGIDPYIRVMQEANFTSNTNCYIATGLFDHKSDADIAEVKDKFGGVCGSIFHKENLLPPEAFDGLHSEQRALVNFLVLSRADKLVGDNFSTFSKFCREYRALNGISKRTFFSSHAEYRLGNGFEYYVPDEVHPHSPPSCPNPQLLLQRVVGYDANAQNCPNLT